MLVNLALFLKLVIDADITFVTLVAIANFLDHFGNFELIKLVLVLFFGDPCLLRLVKHRLIDRVNACIPLVFHVFDFPNLFLLFGDGVLYFYLDGHEEYVDFFIFM